MIVSRRFSAFIVPFAVSVCFFSACSSQPAKTPAAGAPAPAAAPPAPPDPSAHAVIGKAPAAVNGQPAIIVLAPQTPKEYPPPAAKPYMDQVTLTFTPPFLFVRTGQPTEFRNSDDVLHNVRVRDESTREGLFNVAIPTGGTYSHTFPRDGFYDVGCDIHPGMSAQIISASTPYVTMADAQGNFVFDDVEPGAYVATIYSGTEKIERKVEVSGPKTEVGS